ncbi:MAG: DNA-binding protein [Motiliproteus sp.]
MSITLTPEIIRDIADRLLLGGVKPSAKTISRQLGVVDDGSIDTELERWWLGLSTRVSIVADTDAKAPDAMTRAVQVLWQDAVKEAVSQLSLEHRSLDSSIQTMRQESEDLLVSSRADYDTLETRYRREAERAGETENQIKALNAEISVLKSNLAAEVKLRNQAEEQLLDVRHEVKRGAKVLEDARHTFDGRLKDEQAHNHELLSKSEAELRHYRTSLEVVRDEASKKESVLTRNIHDLQSEVAKRDVKIETQQGQIKSLETELKAMRTDTGSQARRLSQANSKLLSEGNKNKRLEERLKKLESELKKEQQRLSLHSSEAMRKESELRQAVKSYEDDVQRVKSSLNNAQKKLITQDEQIRRLHAQANI